MFKDLKSKKEGFTIIEVLIVLAIAALILLIVFLAVPALQRNSRNTQRKSDISAMLGAISEFVSNNSGVVPTAACSVSGADYKMVTGTCAASTGTEARFKLGYYTVAPTVQTTAVTTAPTTDVVIIATGNKCAATAGQTTTTGAAARGIAAVYTVESGNTLSATCQES
jgi:prepilin-type N-terminal cleavage/methylation domain-containing protein